MQKHSLSLNSEKRLWYAATAEVMAGFQTKGEKKKKFLSKTLLMSDFLINQPADKARYNLMIAVNAI